eukprot:scaffold1387_cov103-Cylindrotheca_fusiformis.AAC.4
MDLIADCTLNLGAAFSTLIEGFFSTTLNLLLPRVQRAVCWFERVDSRLMWAEKAFCRGLECPASNLY